jgi:hypothetical protein
VRPLHPAWIAVFVVATLPLVWTSPAVALAASTRRVIVRTYDTYGFSPSDIRTASRTVNGLLSTIAIDMRWRNCRIATRRETRMLDACADPIARNEFIVRMIGVDMPSDAAGMTLGYAFVDPVLRTGSLATIHGDRVMALSQTLDLDRGTLLGRAVAHEVGHLLLGSQSHSAFGLMRGQWTTSTLHENRPADWIFSVEQGAAIRLSLDARRDLATRAGARIAGRK